jgi:hypothetical protein
MNGKAYEDQACVWIIHDRVSKRAIMHHIIHNGVVTVPGFVLNTHGDVVIRKEHRWPMEARDIHIRLF